MPTRIGYPVVASCWPQVAEFGARSAIPGDAERTVGATRRVTVQNPGATLDYTVSTATSWGCDDTLCVNLKIVRLRSVG